jgi:hypothetical protein
MPKTPGTTLSIAAILTLAAGAFSPASAQVSVNLDLATNSAYQWRGTTMTNRPVLQPDLLVSVPAKGWTLLAGVSANIEPVKYADPYTDISERGGTSAGVAEMDIWAEASRTIGTARVTLGALDYHFPNTAGLTPAQNTFEVYGRVTLDAPLAPTAQVWVDLWRVNGSYAELSIAQDLDVGGRSWHFAALQGVNVSQHYDAATNEGYFARAGFTHTDLSVSTVFTLGSVAATPSLHLLLAQDAKTWITAPGVEADTKLWLGISLGWARTFWAPREEAAARTRGAEVATKQ